MNRTRIACVSTGLLFLHGLALAADHPEIPLRAGGNQTAKEIVEPPNKDHGYLKVTSIHNPSITVYLPPREKATGAAVVIAPGGAHRFLNFDQEGTYVAEYLNSIGVAGFVLKYRLAREPGSTYKIEIDALGDAQRAIRLIRSRAEEWRVNPARVGIMGFSAGGEVAALAATRFDAGKPDSADPIDRLSSRPDFDALIYPGIRADNYTIPKDMPVTFMLCADNDRGPSSALAGLYPMLKAAGIQTEVHVYASGGHGFGINPNTKNASPVATTWQLRLGDWLKDIGMRAEDYYPQPDAKGGWRTLKDTVEIRKVAGIDTQKLDDTFEYIQQTSQHGGLLVVRHGWLVYERYFGRGNREALPELASCGKAFTSIAVGIMLKEKADLIPNGLDEKVFTPKYMPAEIFPLDDPRKADITLGQLLSMSAGIRGINPVYVQGKKQTWDSQAVDNGPYSTTDSFALHQSLWCAPGECYSYATSAPHLASIVLRRLTGMEMEDYMRRRLTEPLGFGAWGYAMYRPRLKGGIDAEGRMYHTPGGGSNAVRSTDVLRFAYLLLHEGKWGDKQIVPADFVRMCGRMVKYNPHYTHSFNFNVNEDGHVAGAPRDAFWKGGSGGYCIYVVPSLDLVIYKMGGTEGQYDPALTRLPVAYRYDGSRDGWKAGDPRVVGDSTGKTLEMVVAAVQR